MNFFCLYITNGITKKFHMNKIYCHIYQNYLGRNTCHYRDKIETKQFKTIETKNKSYFMNKSVRHVRNLYHGSAIKCTDNVTIQTKYNSPEQIIALTRTDWSKTQWNHHISECFTNLTASESKIIILTIQ